jgi:hypothetical protein
MGETDRQTECEKFAEGDGQEMDDGVVIFQNEADARVPSGIRLDLGYTVKPDSRRGTYNRDQATHKSP